MNELLNAEGLSGVLSLGDIRKHPNGAGLQVLAEESRAQGVQTQTTEVEGLAVALLDVERPALA